MASGPNQSQLSAAALANLAAQNKLLQEQVILTNAINQVLKDNIDEISTSGNKIREQLAKAGVDTSKSNEMLQSSIVKGSKMSQASLQAQYGSVSGLQALWEQFKITALDAGEGSKETLVSMKDVANRANNVLKDLSKDWVNAMSEIQKAVGGNAIGSVNTVNQTATRLVSLATDAIDDYYSGVIPELNASFRSIFATPEEYYGYISALAEGGTVVHQMLQDLTNEQIKQGVLLGKGMDLNARDVQSILQRTFARQGETSIDMLEKMAHYSKAMEAETGIGAKVIAEQMAGLITDTKNFANITEAQAAKASASLIKLGLEYKDLGSMAASFQGFEQAAGNVADLTAAFGVQLDVMKMMHYANEDQGEMLLYIRKQFLASGKDVRTMSAAHKRVLMMKTGLGSIEAVEQLFNPQIVDDVAALEAATAVGSEGASAALEGLTEDIERVVTHSEDLTDVVTERLASALAVKLAPAAGKASIAMARLADDLPVKAFASMEGAIKKLEDMGKMDLSGVSADIGKAGKMIENLLKTLNSADISKNIEPLIKTITALADPIGKAFLKGFQALRPEMKKVFVGMAEDIKEALKEGEAKSMSPLARKYFYEGFAIAAKAAGKDINEQFNPSNLSSIVELRSLLPQMIKDGTIQSSKELDKFMNASNKQTLKWSGRWHKAMTPKVDPAEIKKRNQSLTEGLAEAIQGGSVSIEKYLKHSGDKIKDLYFKDIKSSEDVLANYSKIAKHLEPLRSQLEKSGYDFDNLTKKTQDSLKPLMRIGGMNIMDLMKIDPKELTKLEGMNKQFESTKTSFEAFKSSGLTSAEFFGGKEGEKRLKSIVKQGQFASGAAAMAAMQNGDMLDKHLAEKRSEFYIDAIAAAEEAEQLGAKAGKKGSKAGHSSSRVTVDISKSVSRSIAELNKSVNELKKVKANQQKIVIHLPKMKLGQTEIEIFAKKLLEVRMLDGKLIAQDGAGNDQQQE